MKIETTTPSFEQQLSENRLRVLWYIYRYRVLSTKQIADLVWPGRKLNEVRSLLSRMHRKGVINKVPNEVNTPGWGGEHRYGRLYYPSQAGCQALSVALDDPNIMETACVSAPKWTEGGHYLARSSFHIQFDREIEQSPQLQSPRWIDEWDVLDAEADGKNHPDKKYILYTKMQIPNAKLNDTGETITSPGKKKTVVCVPDSAFLLSMTMKEKTYVKSFYCEFERGGNKPTSAAATKWQGYFGLHSQQLHRHHFPEATLPLAVLVIAPTPNWRDQLRRAFAKYPGRELYKMSAWSELVSKGILHGSVWYGTDENAEPQPLVRTDVSGT